MPVQGDGCQHVVGGGQGEGLQELERVKVIINVFKQSFLRSNFYFRHSVCHKLVVSFLLYIRGIFFVAIIFLAATNFLSTFFFGCAGAMSMLQHLSMDSCVKYLEHFMCSEVCFKKKVQ